MTYLDRTEDSELHLAPPRPKERQPLGRFTPRLQPVLDSTCMPPADALVLAANVALADPNVQLTVRQMHQEDGVPLVQMVEALGLDDDMSDRIREIVEQLPPDVVAGIRQATLTMLDADQDQLPVDCSVTQDELASGTPVTVDVVATQGPATIRVRSDSTT